MFLIVFSVLLLLSGMLLSVPGNYWSWFAIMAGCAMVAAVMGPKWYRVGGIAAAALSAVLIISDLKAGVEHRKRFERFRNRSMGTATTNGELQHSADESQPFRSSTNLGSEAAGTRR
jgi:membrane protein implicated in regulation of membrane protease activity